MQSWMQIVVLAVSVMLGAIVLQKPQDSGQFVDKGWTLNPIVSLMARMRRGSLGLAALLLFAWGTGVCAQAPGTLDQSWNHELSMGPTKVNVLAHQANGDLIIAGEFSSFRGVPRNNIARLKDEFAVDHVFDPNVNGGVHCAIVLPDGKILIGGAFTTVSGTTRNRIARLNSNGTPDHGFIDPALDGTVQHMRLLPDGKILIAGSFGRVSGAPRRAVARLNADGTNDATFNANVGSGDVTALARDEQGRILIAGTFTQVGGLARNRIARVNASGGLDAVFNPGLTGTVHAIAVQPTGGILLAGTFTQVGSASRKNFARLDSAGMLDAGFNFQFDNPIYSMLLQADGKVVVGGDFAKIGSLWRNRVARITANGQVDPGFVATGPNGKVTALAMQENGRILLGGDFSALGNDIKLRLARLHNDAASSAFRVTTDGQVIWSRGGGAPEVAGVDFEMTTDDVLWTLLGAGARIGTTADWGLAGLSLPPKGRVRAIARTASGSSNGSQGLISYQSTYGPGSLDEGFIRDLEQDETVMAMAEQLDGKAVIGGSRFSHVFGWTAVYHGWITRLKKDGSEDTSFTRQTTDGPVKSVVVLPDGRLVIGGAFTQVGSSTARNRIARLSAQGMADSSFNAGTNGDVNTVILQSDGKLLVAGKFTEVNGTARNRIARTDGNGVLEGTFDPNVDGEIRSVVLQGDGKIIIAGAFTSVDGVARARVARLDASGEVDMDFAPSVNGNVNVVSVEDDGQILLGGAFTQVDGASRGGFARLEANGALDEAFVPEMTGEPFSLALQSDQRILVAGQVSGGATGSQDLVLRLHQDGSLDAPFCPVVTSFVSAADDVTGVMLLSDGKVLLGGAFKKVNGGMYPQLARLNNDDAGISSTLTAPAFSEFLWTRSGTAPSVSGVSFEWSSGSLAGPWHPLGPGVRVGSTSQWKASGTITDAIGIVRATGWVRGAHGSGSMHYVQQMEYYSAPGPEIWVLASWMNLNPSAPFTFTPSNFGETETGKTSPVLGTFTIYNQGSQDLIVPSITVTGDHAAEFVLDTVGTVNKVAAGASTELRVRFTPAALGVRNAQLRIASNDANENPVELGLTGTGTPPRGVVSIDPAAGPVITVTEGTPTVQIPIVRTGGDYGMLPFKVVTSDETALAGSDYVAVPPPLTLWPHHSMAPGVTSTTVPITILNTTGATDEPHETFVVTLAQGYYGTQLGAVTSIRVRILDSADTVPPPAPVITVSPPHGAVLNFASASGVTMRGTATDNKGVTTVMVSLNNGASFNATLSDPGAAATEWSYTFTPVSGVNAVVVQSYDVQNRQSPPTMRSFSVARGLSVQVFPAGMGTVTPGFGGTAPRELGKSYTLTATPRAMPDPGTVFTGWTLGGSDVGNGGVAFTPERIGVVLSALAKPTLTFIFCEGLTLTANFADNPYGSSVIGTYTGLVKAHDDLPARPDAEPDGTQPGIGSEGYFTATVTKTGAFSGKLTIDGFVLKVAGIFDHEGKARFGTARAETLTVARLNKPSLIVNFDIGGVPGSVAQAGTITGQVMAKQFLKSAVSTSVSTVSADRAPFSGLAGSVVPDEYLTVTGTAASPSGRTDGVFTVVLPSVPLASQPDRIKGVLTAKDYPKGTGVGTIKVSKAGAVSLTATLADGTALTASGKLSQDLRVALFARLYSLKGFFSAELKLDGAQAGSDVTKATGSEVLWNRPFMGASHYYPFGWADTLELDLLGARYRATVGESVLKGANGAPLGDPADDGNVTLNFSDGALEAAVVKSANLSRTDAVVKVPDNDPTFTMKVNRTTGMVTGIFDHTDDTKPGYNAIILQKGPNAAAQGFFLTKQPVPIDGTGESGGVLVIGQP
jgi:uncharacterized delta-60 repeat protein